MPCQCNSTAASAAEGASAACECGSADPAGACECGAGGGAPRSSLERVVMELDKRLRALETSVRS